MISSFTRQILFVLLFLFSVQNVHSEGIILKQAQAWLNSKVENLERDNLNLVDEQEKLNTEVATLQEKLSITRQSGVSASAIKPLKDLLNDKKSRLENIEKSLAENKNKIETLDASDYISSEEFQQEYGTYLNQVNNLEFDFQSLEEKGELEKIQFLEDLEKSKDKYLNEDNLNNVFQDISSKKVKDKYKVTETVLDQNSGIESLNFEKVTTFKEHLFFEADLSLTSNEMIPVNISPLLGYQISDKFSIGLGTAYQNLDGLESNLRGVWSGRFMARLNVLDDVLSFQTESISRISDTQSFTRENQNRISQLIGGRISLPKSSMIPLNFSFMHNLNPTLENPAYSAPWLMKLGFVF